MIMHQLDSRVRKMLEVINSFRIRREEDIPDIEASFDSETYTPFANGDVWAANEGENWVNFRFRCEVPEDFYGKPKLVLHTGMEEGWEAIMPQILVRINGRIEQSFDSRHTEVVLQDKAVPHSSFEVILEAYFNTKRTPAGLMMPRMKLAVADSMEDVSRLWYDISVPYQAAMLLPEDSREREQVLYVLSDTLNLLDLRHPFSEAFHKSFLDAEQYIQTHYYETLKNAEPEAIADCIGHTHIDVAWLWDLYQTRHKAVRTFATMLKLMEQYPEFKFMSSQPQLYQFVKEDAPELFERIREAVASGRWEAEGGMWVEADCNLSGGESLVRQLLYGNEFFETEFGRRSRILWLPDVFGYSAALPQILKKSGIRYFMTSKLSWSEFNCSPYDTFMWKGIDGTEILTHFTPSRDYDSGKHEDLSYYTTYNAMLAPDQIKGGWRRFQQKGLDNHYIVTYGFGDGGGGSTDWMIENSRRMQNSVAGCPAVRHTFALDFFKELEKRVSDNKRLPKWTGELYLEYHRGTYTSQAKNKRNNRKAEIALRDLEFKLTRANDLFGFPWPQDELRQLWRQVLTLQFHDILPGSSIHKVYMDSDQIYAEVFDRIKQMDDEVTDVLIKGQGGDLQLFNTLSSRRSDVFSFRGPEGLCALRDAAGKEWPVQEIGPGEYIAYIGNLAAMSCTSVWYVYGPQAVSDMKADTHSFETPFFTGTFDEAMRIDHLIDKDSKRELVRKGEALNSLIYYENLPHNYDAWDINIYYDEKCWPVDRLKSAQVISNGPVAAVVRAEWEAGDSVIREDMYFWHDIKRIDFRTKADWKEKHGLLKAHFPLDVFYTSAQFDIQYGNVSRPTHKNTSWDVARFEVCAHKWADVGEPAYGVALMSDCKYGYSVDENSIALSLIKSATYPDETADQGMHEFTYAIAPHCGDWRKANIPTRAYEMNVPINVCTGCCAAAEPGKKDRSFAHLDCDNVIIESVKKALHGEGTVIRLYECFGSRTNTCLTLDRIPKKVMYTTLMEDDEREAAFTENKISLEFKPYEIITLRLLW